ncbi:MAG: glutamyl-tRNA reductase [Chitinivibrionales bacterium]|nr:glutamyl-tRNA reductase [Chitinivibrionales bacterium]
MWFGMIGLSFRTAPIEVREAMAFHAEDLPAALKLLTAKDDAREAVIVSTCNRVEIYAVLSRPNISLLRDFLRDFHKYSGPLEQHLYQHEDKAAVEHLCRVATGIDSMVTGEPQIFGQIKEAYRAALQHGATGRALGVLFPQVFGIVKKARTKSGIGERHVSVGYAAVDSARELFGDLAGRSVMVLGAGEIGELTTRDLRSCGVTDILVVNRTFSKAVEVAERVNGTPIMFHELAEYLPRSDILIGSAGGGQYLLTPEHFARALDIRSGRPMLAIDIALPRCIDPEAAHIEGIRLLNIDDLREAAARGAEERKQAVERAEAIIRGKSDDVIGKVKSSDIIPTISSIRREAELIRRRGVTETVAKIAVGEVERQQIDALTKSIVNKVLFHSELKLREYSSSIRR